MLWSRDTVGSLGHRDRFFTGPHPPRIHRIPDRPSESRALKLKNVNISGFKSFVEPVTAEFADGITAVVGPNGCGKSNLSEAITWVLGEQSAKTLRGGRMEDVIFSGTQQRRALGMAEVNITMAADPGSEHAKDGEIVIGRRVFRGGEGQYRLNDKVVRLKEIKDLLADTGLGVRAYSVIEQGRIGQILSTKPQERRKLIEEAAGITRYKQRKRLAELKLEEATANQMRLDDILSEVDRARRSLKRQSNAARRFKEREADYKELLNRVLRGRWSRQLQQLEELRQGIEGATDRDAELSADLSRAEAELAGKREQLEQVGEQMASLSSENAAHLATIEGRQEFLRGSRGTLEEVNERLANGKTVDGQRHDQLAAFRQTLLELDAARQVLEVEHDQAKAAFDADQGCVRAATAALETAEATAAEWRTKLAEAEAILDELRERRHRLLVNSEKTAYRRDHSQTEIAAKLEQLEAAAAELEQAGDRVTQLQGEIDDQAKHRAEQKAALEALLRREAESTQERKQFENRRLALAQRHELLEELAEAEEQRRQALIEALQDLGISEPRFLQDEAKVPKGWEESLDLFLEPLSDAVLLPSGKNALDLARQLSAKGCDATLLQAAGPERHDPRAWLQRPVTEAKEASSRPAEADDEEQVKKLQVELAENDSVQESEQQSEQQSRKQSEGQAERPSNGGRLSLWQAILQPFRRKREVTPRQNTAPPEDLARRSDMARQADRTRQAERAFATEKARKAETARQEELARQKDLSLIEASLGEALGLPAEYTRSLPPAFLVENSEAAQTLAGRYPGVAFLSRDRLWAQNGIVHAQSQTAAPGTLSRNRELESIASDIPTVDGQIETLSTVLKNLVQERTQGATEINQIDAGIAERKQEHAVAQARRQDCLHRRDRTKEEHQQLEEELQEIEAELTQLAEDRSAIDTEIETARTTRTEIENELQSAVQKLEQARQVREAANTESAGREGQLRLVVQKLESHAGEARRIDQQTQEARSLAARWEQEQASLIRRAEELRQAMATAEADLQKALDGKVSLEELQVQYQEKLDHLREQVRAVEKRVAEARDQRDQHRQQIEKLRIAEATHKQESTHLRARYREDFEAELPRSVDQLDEIPDNLPELEEDLAERKGRLEQMGPVNVLAADEYAEQEERHGFLSSQREDVQHSINSLRQTIREINATSKERFQTTFAAVNQAFGETFSELFRGGEASMRLLDEDDVLESGIEIVARPPGKKLQNIQLLSGGEKALAAIALLFALFRTKPSPFCILDEVDAPLDDANILRFVDMLKKMATKTQFVIITHNKLTMEVASALYGVTMEEKGVSRLVGVNVDEIHPQSAIA